MPLTSMTLDTTDSSKFEKFFFPKTIIHRRTQRTAILCHKELLFSKDFI